jgi:hypothetical protein
MGLQMRQLLATLYLTSSRALVALGGSDPTSGFCLRTLSFDRPLDSHGAHFGYGCRIPRCRGRVVFTTPFYSVC